MTSAGGRLLVGAHLSIAGGVHKALLRGREIGASTIQIFTANQKQWRGRPLSGEEVKRWKATLESTGIQAVMSHDSYLINLGSNKEDVLLKSRRAFLEEIERCLSLGLSYLNFHPGAATGDSIERCLDRIVESLLGVAPFLENSRLRLLIETTAGQGSTVGYRFEHLSYLIQCVKGKLPIGVCMDTCHVFAAGYDIRSREGWDATLEAFEGVVGLDYLYALHVNDSKCSLGSRKDRHASLGQGEMGEQCFLAMMAHPKLRNLPKYLETPDETLWEDEIKQLKGYASED